MSLDTSESRKVREAFRLANDLHLNLIVGTQAYRIFQGLFRHRPPKEIVEIGVRLLCLFNVILSLSKWVEYYDHYKGVIPKDVQTHAKKLRKEIKARGIQEFRNNVVGHIWDKTTKQPVTLDEIEKRINKILRTDDVTEFLNWVNDPKNNSFPHNIISIVERVRDRIRETYGFTDKDLV